MSRFQVVDLRYIGNGSHDFFVAAKLETPSAKASFEEAKLKLRGWVVPNIGVGVDVIVRYDDQIIESELNVDRPDVGVSFNTNLRNTKFGFDLICPISEDGSTMTIGLKTTHEEWPWLEVVVIQDNSNLSNSSVESMSTVKSKRKNMKSRSTVKKK